MMSSVPVTKEVSLSESLDTHTHTNQDGTHSRGAGPWDMGVEMSGRIRAAAIGSALALLAGPTAEASSFVSSITNAWVPGAFESRWWSDSNTTATNTSIWYSNCHTGAGTQVTSVRTSLRRRVNNAPDATVSTRWIPCDGGSSFGRVQAGTYRFRILETQPMVSHLNVGEVYVEW
jgi:hypothetical protein